MNKRTLVPHPTNPDLVGVNQYTVEAYARREKIKEGYISCCLWCPEYRPCTGGRGPSCSLIDGEYHVWVPKHIAVAITLEGV